ncbi:dodecin domain-containing protein [Gramella sp. BOM4]|nr:dodecin domain-containing protein [Christiangramia bathymodioli]
MAVVKVIEVMATSNKSFEDAINNAVTEASKTVKNIKSVYVKDMNGKVDGNKITSYGVTTKISFHVGE